jgi:hypothetical protein
MSKKSKNNNVDTSVASQMPKKEYQAKWAKLAVEILMQEFHQQARDPKKIDLSTARGVGCLRASLSGNGNIFDRARPRNAFIQSSIPEIMDEFLSELVKRKPALASSNVSDEVEASESHTLRLVS